MTRDSPWLQVLGELAVCALCIPIGFCAWILTGKAEAALGCASLWYLTVLYYVFPDVRPKWAGREERPGDRDTQP
jgi:hypothetical protein